MRIHNHNRRFNLLRLLLTFALISISTLPACAADDTALPNLAVGAAAPDFQLKDLAGKPHKLSDLKGKVVVLEWVNPNCPFSDRMQREKVMTETGAKHPGAVWLGINSTAADHKDYLAPAEHQAYSRKHGIGHAVLYDESGNTGRAYGARTTPHMFVIDEQGKVIYNGAIDDDPPGRKSKNERQNHVDSALGAHEQGKAPDPASTRPYGCSVKYGAVAPG
jgi:peroxiredoxin